MQSPESHANGPESLLAELYERSSIVRDLDGPQIEAWVSGLYPLLDDQVLPGDLVDYCVARPSDVSQLICAAIAELSAGSDDATADKATAAATGLDDVAGVGAPQIGAPTCTSAWMVEAPFGRSVVVGFDNPVVAQVAEDAEDLLDGDAVDLGHALLVEIGPGGQLEDLQLTGPPRDLVAEATSDDDRVRVTELHVEQATTLIIDAWPASGTTIDASDLGIDPNQQFVRRRLFQLTGTMLPRIEFAEKIVDIRRGLDDAGFSDANRAALSTLRAAVGTIEPSEQSSVLIDTWVGVIQGGGGDLSPRERDALLWLEWADWLGAGIGMLRAGSQSPVSGAAFVDYVNRCPEVSSTIDKADRDYAEWAFAVAIDLLTDAGIVDDEALLTEAGFGALGPAMLQAWSS